MPRSQDKTKFEKKNSVLTLLIYFGRTIKSILISPITSTGKCFPCAF